ncbi:MAG: phosphatidylinositol-specific phospholipase C1-like protein [Actinomycetota bacterium]|nr:phosphatidylinositol-specific phospholipase C1-like protein [Actinomycetota bacterium]
MTTCPFTTTRRPALRQRIPGAGDATRRRLILPVVLGLLAALGPAAGSAQADSRGAGVRLNELQVIGTHNSYKRETSEREQDEYDALISTPGDYDAFLAYSHAKLAPQFGRQDVRGLELDLLGDPQGGLYAEPLVRTRLGLGPLPNPAWRQPGTKVLHIPDFDYKTTCVQLVTCLAEVHDWSEAHPDHVPIPIMLELKRSDSRAVKQGGVVAPAWDEAALDALDAEIRSIFGEDQMVTPDDVRRQGQTLEQSVLHDGWPRLRDSRGQVLFLLDNDPGPIRDAYIAGRPNLEGRVLFTNSRPGLSDAAFIKRNEPRGVNTAQIAELVRRGYYVRTRSDVPLKTVVENDTSMLDAALASGAQLVSTDFPEIGMSARYDSDFVAALPEGGPARCNPVNAPRRCLRLQLEDGR